MRIAGLVLVVCACGGGGGGGDDGDDADDGDDGGAADAFVPPPANNGFVSISSSHFVSGTTTVRAGSISAVFPLASTLACTEERVGECFVYTCPTNPVPPTYRSAGQVTVTGAAVPATLMPQADNTYDVVSSSTQTMFDGGETLTATGGGAEVPAFTVSVVAPSRTTLIAPPKPSGSITIDRGQGFQASWTGGGAGLVFLYFGGPAGSGVSMSCGYPASGGTANVPASALAMVPAGMGSFSASGVSNNTTDVGDWRIYAQGFFNTVWPDMSVVAAMAVLQ
jgi:hypothetical protein